jgi:L-lactate dehydrogenase complex protein LldG
VSGGRETVLSSLRRALGVTGDDTVRRAGVAARLEGAGAGGPSLALGRLSGDAAVQAFVTRAQGLSASVEHVAEIEGLGSAAARVIRRLGLPPRVVMASDPLLLRGMSGFAVQGIATRSGAAEAADSVAVNVAAAAVAETGVVMMTSRPETPTSLNLLPELWICAVPRSRIVGSYEEALALLRRDYGLRLPRAVNFIGGPSRTGDIEEILQLGAHGPKTVHLVIIDAL